MAGPRNSHGRSLPIELMKARSELSRNVGEFAFERTICHDYAAVDGGGRRPG